MCILNLAFGTECGLSQIGLSSVYGGAIGCSVVMTVVGISVVNSVVGGSVVMTVVGESVVKTVVGGSVVITVVGDSVEKRKRLISKLL